MIGWNGFMDLIRLGSDQLALRDPFIVAQDYNVASGCRRADMDFNGVARQQRSQEFPAEVSSEMPGSYLCIDNFMRPCHLGIAGHDWISRHMTEAIERIIRNLEGGVYSGVRCCRLLCGQGKERALDGALYRNVGTEPLLDESIELSYRLEGAGLDRGPDVKMEGGREPGRLVERQLCFWDT